MPRSVRISVSVVSLALMVCLAGSVGADCPVGDLDGSCEVDLGDLGVLAGQWLNGGCSGPNCADLDNTNGVDMVDFALLAENWSEANEPVIVINEIHYRPDVKTELVEFVELYNADTTAIDLSGWYFSGGMSYQFPAGTMLAAGGYIIVVQDVNDIRVKWGSGRFGIKMELVYGPFEGRLENDGERIELRDAEGEQIDQVDYRLGFPWPTVGAAIPASDPGSGHSIQLVNPSFDNDLAGSWRSASPTPTTKNVAVYADNIPPHIRQVNHSPKQVASGEVVTVTAKVTDPDGVSAVTLYYQLVNPGNYISLADGMFWANWTTVAMHDDGAGGDEVAGDDVYTVQLPGSLQTHRWLVRYRILVLDTGGRYVVVPYTDDPQPNFAYFVYDGVPAWSGAIDPDSGDPVKSQVVEYDTSIMRSLPVYHLIAKEQDVVNCQYLPGNQTGQYWGEEYPWSGTLVYDGEVYDHVHYRARGGVWRYSMGKNMWKFDFNRGHYFQARDDYGKKYDTKWDKLNFSACIQQGDYLHRGEQGMFEAVGFKLLNLAGVASAKTHYVQFRVIDAADEFGPTQYDGDFWGLYLVLEQMDGRFLDEHALPDGNLYKMESGTGELNNQGPTGATDKADLYAFMWGYQSYPATSWWLGNVDVDCYFSYRIIVEAIHHYDIGAGKNYFYYLNPETNIWSQFPWDLDLTWADNMYDCGNQGLSPFKRYGLWGNADLRQRRNSRLRELRDLLFNQEHTWKLIDDFAALIDDPNGGPSMVDADRAMWDYNPIMTCAFINPSKAGEGRFYQRASTKDFPGMLNIMRGYVLYRGSSILDPVAADSAIPYTPTIRATGPATFPINALTFETGAFSDPQGSETFGAMKWRIAEITDETNPNYDPGEPKKYEIEAVWESEEITDFNSTIRIPATVVSAGRTYRVRCKMRDNTDRWSHWSDPNQFITGEPVSAGILEHLRITELMYNPAEGGSYDHDEYEFVELKNTGEEPLDLAYVSFVEGITFDFNDSSVTELAPGGFVLVVRNEAAFESRYGSGLSGMIAGEYKDNEQGSLKNSGEQVELVDLWNGTVARFEYSDGRGWPRAADGGGHSLVVLDLALAREPDESLNYGGNWRASSYIGGSPGQDDPDPVTTVVLNEIMAHTDYSNPQRPEYDSNDWIEIYNTSGSGINLSDWYLSDNVGQLKKWALPGIVISGKGRLSFDEVTGFHNPITSGFGLNKAGEEVVLSYLPGNSEDRVADCIVFKGQEVQVSLGRYPDGGWQWGAETASRDSANTEPVLDVVVDEIMYHPVGSNAEYIELYNPTQGALVLENAVGSWRLDGGVGYTFGQGVSIASGGRLIVVGFDPAGEPAELSAFTAAYGTGPLTPGADIVGPWSGSLSNGGEEVSLERPQAPDELGDDVSWVIVDEVMYFDQAPWPGSADGGGDALQRRHTDEYHCGNDPAGWWATSPTPGQ